MTDPRLGTTITHRHYVPHSRAHYGGGLVDGAYLLGRFGEVATDICVRSDGDEGLLAGYSEVRFTAAVRAGDVVEVTGRLTRVGTRSRTLELLATVVCRSRPDRAPSAAEALDPPVVAAVATATVVVPAAATPAAANPAAANPAAATPPAVPERPVHESLRRSQVLAVLRASRYPAPAEVFAALAGHGLRAVEVTLNGDHALAAVQAASEVPGVVVGAGTVTTAEAARDAISAGARFLVAPWGAAAVTAAAGSIPVLPMAYTLHEVFAAWQATAMPVMVFPASASGPAYMSTLAGQVPEVPLLPAGGVDLDNASDYLAAGAMAVAIGESLCPSGSLAAGDLDTITARAARLAARLVDREDPAMAPKSPGGV